MVFGGCAAPVPPQWYYSSQSGERVCGDGEGESAHEAKNQSIASLSHAIGVKIDALYRSQKSVDSEGRYQEQSQTTTLENLFPTLSAPALTYYEMRRKWFYERHYVRSCVTHASIADGLEESLRLDTVWLGEKNKNLMCLSKKMREEYRVHRGEIESKISLLRTYRPDSSMVKTIEKIGYGEPRQPQMALSGDGELIKPIVSERGIVMGNDGGKTRIKTQKEFHPDPTKKGKQKGFLCVLRTVIVIENGCGEIIYEKGFKCVDEGKTKKAAEANARTKMIRVLRQSDLTQALERY